MVSLFVSAGGPSSSSSFSSGRGSVVGPDGSGSGGNSNSAPDGPTRRVIEFLELPKSSGKSPVAVIVYLVVNLGEILSAHFWCVFLEDNLLKFLQK